MAGVALPVRKCRAQGSWFRRPAEFGGLHPVYADSTNQIYARESVVRRGDEEEDCDSLPSDAKGREPRGYGALYSVAADWQPVLNRLPGVGGVLTAVGCSRHGFKLALAVGEVMAE
jgi:glycine/D-amino acid oxidase-like deaminating enzyme